MRREGERLSDSVSRKRYGLICILRKVTLLLYGGMGTGGDIRGIVEQRHGRKGTHQSGQRREKEDTILSRARKLFMPPRRRAGTLGAT